MNKIKITIGVLFFLIVTEYVYLSDVGLNSKKINVSVKKAVLNENSKIKIKEVAPKNVKNVEMTNQNASFDNVESADVKVIEFGGFENSNVQNSNIQNKNVENRNVRNGNIKNVVQNVTQNAIRNETQNITQSEEEFEGYIDWNTWRSRFLNQILDDSNNIPSLNNYEAGSWLYFSFNVTNQGEIKDIKVHSFFLNEDDKELFRELIKSYEGEKITEFPLNSKRKQVKVKAFYVLDNEEKRTRPEDFYDNERIKHD